MSSPKPPPIDNRIFILYFASFIFFIIYMNQQVKLAARPVGMVQGGLEILTHDGFTRAVLKRHNQTTKPPTTAKLLFCWATNSRWGIFGLGSSWGFTLAVRRPARRCLPPPQFALSEQSGLAVGDFAQSAPPSSRGF